MSVSRDIALFLEAFTVLIVFLHQSMFSQGNVVIFESYASQVFLGKGVRVQNGSLSCSLTNHFAVLV